VERNRDSKQPGVVIVTRRAVIILLFLFSTSYLACGPMILSSGPQGVGPAVSAETLRRNVETVERAILSLVYVIAGPEVSAPTARLALGTTPCEFGGSVTRFDDGSARFDACSNLPGFVLSGGLLFSSTPQGERVEYDNLHGTNNGTTFELSGFLETTENPDGTTSVNVHVRSISDDGVYHDDLTSEGTLTVNEDGTISGTLSTSSSETVSECEFSAEGLRDLFLGDPSALAMACRHRCLETSPDCPLNDEPALEEDDDGNGNDDPVDGSGEGSEIEENPSAGGNTGGPSGSPVDGECHPTIGFTVEFELDGSDRPLVPICHPPVSRDLRFEIYTGTIRYPISIRAEADEGPACSFGEFDCVVGPLHGDEFVFEEGDPLFVRSAVDCVDLGIGTYRTHYFFTLVDGDGCEQYTTLGTLVCNETGACPTPE